MDPSKFVAFNVLEDQDLRQGESLSTTCLNTNTNIRDRRGAIRSSAKPQMIHTESPHLFTFVLTTHIVCVL